MELKSAKCPNCGGALQLNPDIKKGICIYCGSEIIVEEAIAAAQNVSGIQTESAARKRAFQKLEDGNVDGADKDFLHIIDLNPEDCEAHFGRFICAIHAADYYRHLNAGMARNLFDYVDSLRYAADSHGERALKFADTTAHKNKYNQQLEIVRKQISLAEEAVIYNNASFFAKLNMTKPQPLSDIRLILD